MYFSGVICGIKGIKDKVIWVGIDWESSMHEVLHKQVREDKAYFSFCDSLRNIALAPYYVLGTEECSDSKAARIRVIMEFIA